MKKDKQDKTIEKIMEMFSLTLKLAGRKLTRRQLENMIINIGNTLQLKRLKK